MARQTFVEFFLLALICSHVLACAAHQRAELKKQHYPTWPPHVQQAVDRGDVILGMDPLQVQISIGVDSGLIKKHTLVTANGVEQTWVLWRSFGGWYFADPGIGTMVMIHFRDGRVSAISTH